MIGEGQAAAGVIDAVTNRGVPALRARLLPDDDSAAPLRGKRVLAFAGIGDPARFVATLRGAGVDVAEQRVFADHHPFTLDEIENLVSEAAAKLLTLVTTEKDMARIRSDARLARHADSIRVLLVTLDFDDEAALRDFVATRLAVCAPKSALGYFRPSSTARIVPLQDRLGCRIGFLPVDAPVFQFVQRDVLAGNGATDIGAGRGHAKVAVEILDLRFTLAGGSEFVEHDHCPCGVRQGFCPENPLNIGMILKSETAFRNGSCLKTKAFSE